MQLLKQMVDKYARTQDGFEKRVGRARKTMIYRAQIRNRCAPHPVDRQMLSKQSRPSNSQLDLDSSFTSPEPPIAFSSPSFVCSSSVLGVSKKNSMADYSSSLKEEDDGGAGRGKSGQGEGREVRRSRRKSKKVSTDTLYAVVIFYEFVKELAAISEEHSVLHSLLYLPNPASSLLVQ